MPYLNFQHHVLYTSELIIRFILSFLFLYDPALKTGEQINDPLDKFLYTPQKGFSQKFRIIFAFLRLIHFREKCKISRKSLRNTNENFCIFL